MVEEIKMESKMTQVERVHGSIWALLDSLNDGSMPSAKLSSYSKQTLDGRLKQNSADYWNANLVSATQEQFRVTLSFRTDSRLDRIADPASGDAIRIDNVTSYDFSLNFSSFNGSPDQCKAYADLIVSANELCKALQETYGGKSREVYRTKEQIEEDRAAERARSLVRKVESLTEELRKGMRAGGKPRTLPRALFSDVPDGRYEFDDHSHSETRSYYVRLHSMTATLRRVS